MKKFDELSLNITEEEYRNNGRFHYSDIAGYIRKGFSYLMAPEKEESESLTFGSLVDCLVTQGMDEFEKRYCVLQDFGLSENQKLVTAKLIMLGYKNIESIDPSVILEVLDQVGLYKNYKTETKVAKIIEECSGYFNFLVGNLGKTAVDFQVYQDAIDVANKVLTSVQSKEFFCNEGENIDRFYQLKFDGNVDGIPVSCMTDALYVDHNEKKVWIIDLKTTCASYEWEFPKAFVKWRYDCQAKLYSTIIRQAMDSDDEYKDYKLEGFVFVYVSRQNKTPLIWTFEKNLDDEDIVIERRNGEKIILEDFRKPLHEMNRIKEEQLKLPADISLMYGNDVLEHLKKMKL